MRDIIIKIKKERRKIKDKEGDIKTNIKKERHNSNDKGET